MSISSSCNQDKGACNAPLSPRLVALQFGEKLHVRYEFLARRSSNASLPTNTRLSMSALVRSSQKAAVLQAFVSFADMIPLALAFQPK